MYALKKKKPSTFTFSQVHIAFLALENFKWCQCRKSLNTVPADSSSPVHASDFIVGEYQLAGSMCLKLLRLSQLRRYSRTQHISQTFINHQSLIHFIQRDGEKEGGDEEGESTT
jgi:hypothetical protein